MNRFWVFFGLFFVDGLEASPSASAVVSNCGPQTLARVCVFEQGANLYSQARKSYVLQVGESIYFSCESEICKLKVMDASNKGCHYSSEVYPVEGNMSFIIKDNRGKHDPSLIEANDC